MIIALDYDETYTRDPEFWLDVVVAARKRGHQVIGVTSRDECDRASMCRRYGALAVFCTGGKAKRKFVYDKGIVVDVWIDDSPEFIGHKPIVFEDAAEPGRAW